MANNEHGNPSYLQQPNAKPHKEAQRVARGGVKARKQSLARRTLASDPNDIRNKVLGDVVIPAVKEMIRKGFMTVLDLSLYGEVRSDVPTTTSKNGRTRTAYNSIYDRQRRKQVSKPLYDFDEVLFDGRDPDDPDSQPDMIKAREDATDVFREMVAYLEDYGFVSVREFYEFSGYETEFTDNKWGWDDLGSANVMRVRDGYIINLPRPIPLEG